LFAVHPVGVEWWASWWDPNCTVPIQGFNFQFLNQNPAAWDHWRTTQAGTDDPNAGIHDRSENHATEPDGLGFRVHVPVLTTPVTPDTWTEVKALFR